MLVLYNAFSKSVLNTIEGDIKIVTKKIDKMRWVSILYKDNKKIVAKEDETPLGSFMKIVWEIFRRFVK